MLSKNIKKLMEKYNINASELARRTGIGQPVINRMINDITTNPNVGTLSPIAAFFSVSIDDLLGELSAIRMKKIPEKNPYSVPLISWIDAAHWENNTTIKKKLEVITISKATSNSAFALKIEDEVDGPFPKGSVLIIEPKRKYKHRDYVIAKTSHQIMATLKRYMLDGDVAYLKPIDPGFATHRIMGDDRILGVVVQTIYDFH